MSVFGVFLVYIFLHLLWTRTFTLYSVRMRENTDHTRKTLNTDTFHSAKSFTEYSFVFPTMTVIFSLFVVPTKGLVVLLRSEYMKEVLSKPDIFPKTNVLNLFFPLFGNGLATATGESHRFQRKFFTKPFSMVHMKYYVPLFNKHAGILTEVNIALHEKCPNTEFFLVRIFPHSDWIRENMDQKKLRIWTLFTQCCYRYSLHNFRFQ